MLENKPLLSSHVREILNEKYGSIMHAASELDLPYERLKMSIRRNRFNAPDLQAIFPTRTVEELENDYRFTLARAYRCIGKSKIGARSLRVLNIEQEDLTFIQQNKVVAERIACMIHEECERLREVLGVT